MRAGTQRQVPNVDQSTLLKFKATSALNQSLKQERKRPDTSSVLVNSGKELLKSAKLEKQNEKFQK